MIDVNQLSMQDVADGILRSSALSQGIYSINVQKGLYLTRSEFTLAEHATYEAQSFPMAALSIMLNGHIIIDINGHDNFSPGDLFAITNAESRVWTSQIQGSERIHNIEVCVTPDWFAAQEPLLRDDPSFDELRRTIERPLSIRRRPLHDRVRYAALEAFNAPSGGLSAALRVEARTLDLIVELAALFQHNEMTSRVTRDRDRVFAIREEIERDPSRITSLQDLSERYGVSASKLKRDFFSVFGTCIGGFINEQRMLFARQLLEEGMVASQVAYKTGYSHPSNFSTAFRRRFGLSPREVSVRSSRPDA